ncbi:hypothetical protein C7M84_006881 [Penaeus vannamei]|uniref:Uncharacterized protein n=1 Tax=Penaeus vannamei TaxID=6689 RepID=A0A3R7QCP8_PENVA|nr:hypothetical protein C7M84_006881 [Penaeus vannamei]
MSHYVTYNALHTPKQYRTTESHLELKDSTRAELLTTAYRDNTHNRPGGNVPLSGGHRCFHPWPRCRRHTRALSYRTRNPRRRDRKITRKATPSDAGDHHRRRRRLSPSPSPSYAWQRGGDPITRGNLTGGDLNANPRRVGPGLAPSGRPPSCLRCLQCYSRKENLKVFSYIRGTAITPGETATASDGRERKPGGGWGRKGRRGMQSVHSPYLLPPPAPAHSKIRNDRWTRNRRQLIKNESHRRAGRLSARDPQTSSSPVSSIFLLDLLMRYFHPPPSSSPLDPLMSTSLPPPSHPSLSLVSFYSLMNPLPSSRPTHEHLPLLLLFFLPLPLPLPLLLLPPLPLFFSLPLPLSLPLLLLPPLPLSIFLSCSSSFFLFPFFSSSFYSSLLFLFLFLFPFFSSPLPFPLTLL